MAIIKKNINIILLNLCIITLICFGFVLARPGFAGSNVGSINSTASPWLAQFIGQNVNVEFNTKDAAYTLEYKLVGIEQSGIVAERANKVVFYPYSHIYSIKPK